MLTVGTFLIKIYLCNSNLYFFFYFILIKNDLWDLIYCFNWPVLICAAQQGHTEVVRLLLSQPGILINYSIINNQKYSWNLMPILNNILN